jgi:hypothetical protein
MSTTDVTGEPAESAASAPATAPAGDPLVTVWRRYAPRAALPGLLLLAVVLGLMLAKAATLPRFRAHGYSQGRAVALRELELRMAQNDSIRHEGEVQAALVLRNVRFFYLGRHSNGWCFLKFADPAGANFSTGWVTDMKFMEFGREYSLVRDGTVWSRPRR